jgi:hypothetical protein
VVEHAAQEVLGARVGGGHLHHLGDGDAKAARAGWVRHHVPPSPREGQHGGKRRVA